MAKRAANQLNPTMSPEPVSKELLAPTLPSPPKYNWDEDQWALSEGGTKEKQDWWKLPDRRLFVPGSLAALVVTRYHEMTHLGKSALESLLSRYYFVPGLPTLCAQVSLRCTICAQNTARQGPRLNLGTVPFEDIHVDFTEIKPCRGSSYLLMLVCTYSGWVQAFPTRTKWAWEVVKGPAVRNNSPVWAALFHRFQ